MVKSVSVGKISIRFRWWGNAKSGIYRLIDGNFNTEALYDKWHTYPEVNLKDENKVF